MSPGGMPHRISLPAAASRRLRLPSKPPPQDSLSLRSKHAPLAPAPSPSTQPTFPQPQHKPWSTNPTPTSSFDEPPTPASLNLERQISGSLASSSSSSTSLTPSAAARRRSDLSGPTISQAYPWLFSNRAAAVADLDVRRSYADLLTAAMQQLQHYDICAPQGRSPNLRKNTQVIEPCLTARAAALEAARRRPRLEATDEEELDQRLTVLVDGPGSSPGQAVDALDELWAQKQRAQQAYQTYLGQMKEQLVTQQGKQAAVLSRLQPAAQVKLQLQAEMDQQLTYQIGIMDDWVQCWHMERTFREQLGPGPWAMLFKRLTELLAAPKARERMSPGEGREFQALCRRMAEHATPCVPSMSGAQLGQVAYGAACLEMGVAAGAGAAAAAAGAPALLLPALVERAGALLSAQLSATKASTPHRGPGEGRTAALQQQGQQERKDGGVEPLRAADYAQLTWALGTLGHRPPAAWLDALCQCCLPRLDVFQASQLWGVLWGLAKLGHVPQQLWMQRFLTCSERIMAEFKAEELCHLIWSLGAMGYVPEKPWLRCFIGQVRAKYRSLLPAQLTELMEGLAAVGYKPREQICWSLQAQARRYLHAFTPQQQATLMRAIAMHSKWQPQRQFLYDFVTHSQPKLASMSAFQLSGILWAFARFKYLPDKSYLKPLLAQLYARMRSSQPSGPALSQALWALAALGLDRPGRAWMQLWSLRARQGLDSFSPQCLAHSLWALGELGAGGEGEGVEAELLEGLLERCAVELPSLSCMELTTAVSSLAALRYRPSDAWLAAALAAAPPPRLAEFSNQDFGLMAWGLASLAAPVDREWLDALTREAGRKWWSMDLEAMALLLWGLAQYGVRPDGREWWAGFWAESELRWAGASGRTLALLTLALAELVQTAPSRGWQRSLMRAIRLTLPKPTTAAGIPAMLRDAAGLGPEEPLPNSLWLQRFIRELGEQWGFARTL